MALSQSLPLKYGLIGAGLGFLVVMSLITGSIFRSTSSTAAIGFIFAPFIAATYSIVFFILGYCTGSVRASLKSSRPLLQSTVLIPGVIAITLASLGTWWLAHGIFMIHEAQQLQPMNSQQISHYFHSSKPTNKFILGIIAQNMSTSPDVLDTIAHLQDADLHRKMGHLLPVMGGNGKGLAVMRLIARHPLVQSSTLEHLGLTSLDAYVLADVAANSKLSTPSIMRIYKNRSQHDQGDYLIMWGVSRNPHAPAYILTEIIKTGNEYARSNVAANPNVLDDNLVLLSNDDSWIVRRSVTDNSRVTIPILMKLRQDADTRVSSQAVYKLAHINQ